MARTRQLYWLAGLLEGEGTFLAGPPSRPRSPIVRLVMTDEDVVARVAAVFGRAVVRVRPRSEKHKSVYMTTLKGGAAVSVMRTLYPVFGSRRRAQVNRAVAVFDGRAARWRKPAFRCSAPDCTRAAATRALCRRHYSVWWKAHRSGRASKIVPHDAPDPLLHPKPLGPAVRDADRDAWLAGLLEGEGSFGVNGRWTAHPYPAIALTMCDEDVVGRAAEIMAARAVHYEASRRETWSPTYSIKISGHQASEWMRRLRPMMFGRRRRAIDGALAAYLPIRLVRPPQTCVVDGCVRKHRSRGLCHMHYMKWSRDRASGRPARVKPLR